MEYILAPSILAADFKILGEQMKATEENGAKIGRASCRERV